MFKRRERFIWPNPERLVQIPPDLPMPKKRSIGLTFKAPEGGFTKVPWPPEKIAEFKRKVFENKNLDK